ncbi:MAG: SDR family oxidoreductase [Gammaproteobacteria bacterium]
MNLKNKTIAITGASGGLGTAMARRLAASGANLALIDLKLDALAGLSRRCEQAGATSVRIYQADVVEEAQTRSLFESIASDFGALHGLVNNAGITQDALTLKTKDGELVSTMSLAQWQRVLDVNLTGVFLCGREAALRMIELDCTGCIINISSISRAGNMGQINYSATKAGVAAMSVVWSKEFARYGIRSAAIAPGFIGTPMVMAMKPEAQARISAAIPAGRVGEPDEIAQTVQFVLENDYVNGRCIEVDGGLRL